MKFATNQTLPPPPRYLDLTSLTHLYILDALDEIPCYLYVHSRKLAVHTSTLLYLYVSYVIDTLVDIVAYSFLCVYLCGPGRLIT